MARDREIVREELLLAERRISYLSRRLTAERARYLALTAELRAEGLPADSAQKRRTPEANMIDSVSRIVHRCRAAKITAEQAKQVAILQISTLAREKYQLDELPQTVRDRVSYEVAQCWGAAL